jgi:protocatechuate 3,4-dioxygenase alpha subunit
MRLIPTPSQTVGPFFNLALTTNPCLGILARDGAEGERIRLTFRVLDGDGAPTTGDSMIEMWQADARGRYAHPLDPRSADSDPNFYGFGRLETDLNGECAFHTIKPGPVGDQAPHINVMVFARGLLKQLYTRVYFDGEAANAHDPVLGMVPEERRATLLARLASGQADAWFVEINLQGDKETVFFDV